MKAAITASLQKSSADPYRGKCKHGAKCPYLRQFGNCRYFHQPSDLKGIVLRNDPRGVPFCRHGNSCPFLRQEGGCFFRHDMGCVPSAAALAASAAVSSAPSKPMKNNVPVKAINLSSIKAIATPTCSSPSSSVMMQGSAPECVVCMGSMEKAFALVPCGHCVCEDCLKTVQDTCHVCSASVKSKMRLFM